MSESTPCPFCSPRDRIVAENEHAAMLWDAYPVSPGHALVVPRRHVATPWELSPAEVADLYALVGEARRRIEAEHAPAGFNLGVNVGAAAGQTVFHLHIHIIPRYLGDDPRPAGGVRRVRRPAVRWVEEP